MSDAEGEVEVLDVTGSAATGTARTIPPPLSLNTTGSSSMPTAVRAMGSEDEFAEDDEMDETIAERLSGLTEMFPEGLRNFTYGASQFSYHGSKALYSMARTGMFAIATSATILVLPIMFESERSQMEEQQLQQQRQILLGPNAAAAAGAGPTMGNPFPSVAPPS